MEKIFYMSILLITNVLAVFSQDVLTYNYDSQNNLIYYERVYLFENKNSEELKNAILKVLTSDLHRISFEDNSDVYAIGAFVTIYKNGSNNTDFRMSCKLHFQIKENKIKLNASNFLLRPKNVVSSSNFDIVGSLTTKVPGEKKIEIFYPRKTDPRHKLFQDMDRQMQDLEKKLKETISPDKDW